ncbi:resistin [Elgaria multicarinata webbii]|uniref:resistin n=1 Tax=Elgaria multicarinata webbii TaxID=159646 RepID=UPI002FCD03AE
MMKTILFLLFAGFVSATWAYTPTCEVDDVLDRKITEAIKSTASNSQLVCQSVTTRGADATCPSGFKPTGCACGMACGSWDIRGDITCHCQCAGIDWTNARCCKIVNGH